MMQYENYFPLGIAKGDAFIGRDEEARWLQRNIEANVHTLLLAPRRYGKSSLVLHVLEKNKTAFLELDLQLCRSAKSVEKKILRGVENIIASAVKDKENILQTAKAFFKGSRKEWKIGLKGFVELSIEPDRYDDVAENILTALQFLDAALAKEDKKAIIYMDEVQEIIRLELSSEIQGAIRHFAQKTSRVVFVFSGSNRRMLRHMFTDNSMPLYQLCDGITLGKISEKTYVNYLRKVSKKSWKESLSDDIICEIIRLSERHPRRIYNLCLYLWRLSDISGKHPQLKNVNDAWQKLINSEAKGIRYSLSKRNTSQLKLLAYIALDGKSALTGKDAQIATDLSSTALSKALQQLEENDLVERNEHGVLHIVDPVVRDTLALYEKELIN